MKVLAYLFSILLVSLLGLVWCVSLAIEDEAVVTANATLTPADLRRARQLLDSVYAAAGRDNGNSTLSFTANDIDLLLAHILTASGGGAARSTLGNDSIELAISLDIPATIFGDTVNTTMQLQMASGQLTLTHLQAGRLEIPDWIADELIRQMHLQLLRRIPEYADLIASIRSVSISPAAVTVSYRLSEQTLERLTSGGRQLLIEEGFTERLMAHASHLQELLSPVTGQRRIAMTSVMSPMFSYAASRSGNAAEENRAAILVLAMHMMDVDISSLLQGRVPQGEYNSRPEFTLYGRADIARHYLGSAALAISTDSALADSIGLMKELEDTRDGSGFSFTDLAADLAGIRFGELAVSGSASAMRMQQLLGTDINDSYVMFEFSDLPEYLNAEEFSSVYSDPQSEQYLALTETIRRRINQTPLFSQF